MQNMGYNGPTRIKFNVPPPFSIDFKHKIS